MTIGEMIKGTASAQALEQLTETAARRKYERERKRRWRAYRRQAGVAPNGRTIRPVAVAVKPDLSGYDVLKVVR